jgi:hypothetical protein
MATNISQKRLRFERAEELADEDPQQCRVEVTLTLGKQVITASHRGDRDGLGPLKAAAAAALEAVEEAVEGRFKCRMTDLDHVNALGKDLIAVLVDVEFEGKEVQVFGSCGVQESEVATSVKAALNATNRFFELAMRD